MSDTAGGSGERGTVAAEAAAAPRADEAEANRTCDAAPVAALDATDLEVGFGAATVLSGVSLRIERGVVTALLGPTGSGKTTFLRSLNRLNDKVAGHRRSGDIRLDGRSIFDRDMDVMVLRRRVGMLFQRPNPFPMSIRDNITVGARAHGIVPRRRSAEAAERTLRRVGLWDAVRHRLGDSPFRLSGGQQQLLCLARALAVEPEVLLLDEPTSALDPVTTEAIEGLIRSLTPRLTVVVVTHNLAQARRISDRTVFFHSGRLVEDGPTEQIFTRPAQPETARYIGGETT